MAALPNGIAYRIICPDYLSTDTGNNFGNSGAFLLNSQGKVIGVDVATVTQTNETKRLGFAIPTKTAVNIAAPLISDMASFGRIILTQKEVKLMSKLQHKIFTKMKHHWKLCIGTIMVLFVFTASSALGAKVLFVVGKKDLRASDRFIKNHIENRGIKVIIREDKTVKTEDASGTDLVILSESARSREIGTKFRDVAVPVICSEPWLFGNLGMTGHTKKVDFGRKSHQKTIVIINHSHPLCASCSKEVQVCAKRFYMGWGLPGKNAITVAGLSTDPNKCTIFAYEVGVEMPGLISPARRVGLFLFRNTANSLTPEGWSLFDAAVDWSISGTQTAIKSEIHTKTAEE